jgi:hypothetical protein
MKHLIEHDLDLPTAKRVVDRAFGEYKSRFPDYKPSLVWVNERRADVAFHAKGVKLAGGMQLEPAAIALELDVPFFFKPFQKVALEVIEREVRLWVGKARAGQL